MKKIIFLFIIAFTFSALAETEVKIKNEVNVVGVRPNFLVGYGIVVGLNGTGDGTTSRFTLLSIANMLRKMGIYIDPAQVKTKNAAAVIVTASLPPYAKSGMRFNVNVASLGDAKNIGNGVLIRTPLMGPDGKIYAFAQGPVSTGGGFSESNKGGKIQKNFPTTGIIVNGGIVERDLPFNFENKKEIVLTLKNPNFDTATKIEKSINNYFGAKIAKAIDVSTVKVEIPSEIKDKVAFLNEVLNQKITVSNDPVVVIDERTGTVIMGGDIKLDTPIYVSHGNIYVEVTKTPVVSQPPPLSAGATATTTQVKTNIKEEKGRIFGIKSPTLKDLVDVLNTVGVSPRDLIAIIQAIKEAGKIHAKIEVM
ncbi:flagellar basal body P-ring protein FlgI [Hydrogenothermus marinus]|uniref:Flagellar P-ring protein n=1 Tax=Hydrogenothermus marinus TaxID=133270 RepID=A0A3M0BRM9_9AQUI|nr:flagellar basal body P-ring protein FlgI [Hydrogenothermus marinus]RMA97498.1 flagellar P-ring protein precursor FlgI [Hydrogenothermus marinus]